MIDGLGLAAIWFGVGLTAGILGTMYALRRQPADVEDVHHIPVRRLVNDGSLAEYERLLRRARQRAKEQQAQR